MRSIDMPKMSKMPHQAAEWQSHFAVPVQAWPQAAIELMDSSPYSLTYIAKCLGIGRTTLYRMLRSPDPGLLTRHAVIEGLKLLQA